MSCFGQMSQIIPGSSFDFLYYADVYIYNTTFEEFSFHPVPAKFGCHYFKTHCSVLNSLLTTNPVPNFRSLS
jgi:hypothetical protein